MTLRTLRRRRREGSRTAAIAIMGAGGILAGTALAWFLSPARGAERRERTGRALRGAAERARAEARAVSTRASEALHGVPGRLRAEAKAAVAEAGTLPTRAREAADAVRARADRGRAALEARGWSPRQTALGVAGGALIGRAVLGRGVLRIPAGLLGASILARAVSGSPGLRRGMRRAEEAAHDAAERLRGREEAGAGASEPRPPRPEVREGKSPAELEQGTATSRPEQAFAGLGAGEPRILGPDGEPATQRAPVARTEPIAGAPARREPGEDDGG